MRDQAEPLDTFLRPEHAVCVFGPEDGSLDRGTLTGCHSLLGIPTAVRAPLNLAAVNIVLYDRHANALQARR